MSLSRRRFALSAPLAAAAVGSMTWAGRAQAAGQVFTVPFLMPRDKPYILIGINGKGPYRFTLDTGASGKMGIDAHLAHELQLPDYDSERHAGVVGEAQQSGLYAADVVNFGGAFTQRHVALDGIGEGRLKRIGTVGLIPAPFFLNRPCELDFERTELRIYAEGAPDRTGFSPLPFIAQNRDQIFVDAKFNGIPCRLQVDTGAEGGLVLQPRFVRRNRLWDAYPRHLDSGVRGITGGAKSRKVKGDALEFGGFRFRNPVATLIDPEATSKLDEDGLIGIDILRRFTLSFDGADHRIWLKPNRFIAEPFYYDRVGVSVWYYPDRREAFVVKVEEGASGAKAGLAEGDRLPDVRSIQQADDLQWRLNSALTGDVIELKTERAGQPRPVKIAVEDRL